MARTSADELVGVLAGDELGGELLGLALGQADEGFVETLDEGTGADLVGQALGGRVVDGLAVDGGGHVDGDEVTVGDGALDRLQGAEAGLQVAQLVVDSLGVGETEVTTSGDRQIIVAVPNVQQDELVRLVGQTAVLRFRAVYGAEAVTPPVTPSTAPSGSATPTTEPSAGAPSASPSGDRRPAPQLPTAPPAPTTTCVARSSPTTTRPGTWTPSSCARG